MDDPAPKIEVDPPTLALGSVLEGTAVEGSVTVRNVGSEALNLTDLTVDGPYVLAGDTVPMTLLPDESRVWSVHWPAVEAGVFEHAVTVTSDDPKRGAVDVPIALTGLATAVVIDNVDFSYVAIGTQVGRQTTLRNTGEWPVTVRSLGTTDPHFGLLEPPALPFTVEPGEEWPFQVVFAPLEEVPYVAMIAASTDLGPVQAALIGEGVTAELELRPDPLDFGVQLRGSQTELSATIANTGLAPLVLHGLSIDGSTFTGTFPALPMELDPGSELSIPVLFQPTEEGLFSGALHADAESAGASIQLLGESLDPALLIDPEYQDLGEVGLGCIEPATVQLVNAGEVTVQIDELTTSEAFLTLTSPPPLPLLLHPGETTDLALGVQALEPNVVGADLVVRSNDPDGPDTASLSILGTRPRVEESFEVPEAQADIFFHVDQSGSMYDDAEALSDNFTAFTNALTDDHGIDYQIIVVTSSDGCHNETIFTPHTADFETRFDAAVHGPIGSGYDTERGLVLSDRALDVSHAVGCNAGFLRENTPTVLVFVSDEPDQSPHSWDYYVDRGRDRTASVVYHGIVGIDGCGYGADGYEEAALATGGTLLSLCRLDWGAALVDLAGTIPGAVLPLSQEPLLDEDMLVSQAGEPIDSGWAYDAGDNAIRVEVGALDGASDTVEVSYAVSGNVCP